MSTRAGQLAIASGIVGILATLVLIAFFILEAPQTVAAGAKTSRLGALNDALGGIQLLLLLPVAARLALAGNLPSRLGAIAGVVGLAAGAIASELYVLELIGFTVNYPMVAAGNGLVGVWILTISLGGEPRLARGLKRLGIATGAGLLMIPLGVFLLGGLGSLSDSRLALRNYPFLATAAIGITAFAIALPIWSIWLGRQLRVAKAEARNLPPA
ncbi:MAG: hypothetical protein E6I63_07435 [Chloroflexi bacterium]|nr:MAG: hypothetical protein E6I63_07435 [Chloroflexota bacterium]